MSKKKFELIPAFNLEILKSHEYGYVVRADALEKVLEEITDLLPDIFLEMDDGDEVH